MTEPWIDTGGRLEFNPANDDDGNARPCVVNVGCGQSVTVDKLYGPLIFCDVRVTALFATCEWLVERQHIETGQWTEVARIPGQIEGEFPDE